LIDVRPEIANSNLNIKATAKGEWRNTGLMFGEGTMSKLHIHCWIAIFLAKCFAMSKKGSLRMTAILGFVC